MNPPQKQLHSPPETTRVRNLLIHPTSKKPYPTLIPRKTATRHRLINRLRHLVQILIIHPGPILPRCRTVRIISILARIFVQVINHPVYQIVIYIHLTNIYANRKLPLPLIRKNNLYSSIYHKANITDISYINKYTNKIKSYLYRILQQSIKLIP